MDVTLLMKIAGIGILAGVLCQVLKGSGKDELAGFVTLGGIIISLFLIIDKITELLSAVRNTFGL